MRNKTIKAFARQYNGLILLSTSNEGITLGDLYDKKGRYKIDFTGFNVAFKCIADSEKAEKLKTTLTKTRALKGEFANIQLKGNFEGRGDVALSFLKLNLGGDVNSSQFKSYEIGNIKKKTLRDRSLVKVVNALKQYHSNDRSVQKLWIAESLFYGSEIKITIDKTVKANAAARLAKKASANNLSVDAKGNHVFTFSGATSYPFAIDLKKVKELI